MLELVYISRASKRFNQNELLDILSVARKNNTINDVTGLLLYDGYGTFIQALEGNDESIEQLYSVIKGDTRHSRINVLWRNPIKQRSFPDWQMGFRALDQSFNQAMDGYSDFLQQPDKSHFLSSNPNFVTEMLNHFRARSTS